MATLAQNPTPSEVEDSTRRKRTRLTGRSFISILCQPSKILLDRVAEVGGQIAADLLEGLLALFGGQVAPVVLFAEVLLIDLVGGLDVAGGLRLLGRLGRSLLRRVLLLLLLLLLLL